MTREQIRNFLADLTEVSRKHGIKIEGCGCCGSPYLEECASTGEYELPIISEENGHVKGVENLKFTGE